MVHIIKASTVTARIRTPPPYIDLRAISTGVDDRMLKIYSSKTLAEDVRYLQENGVPVAVIARSLGIYRGRIYEWMSGETATRNPRYIMIIRQWALEMKAKIVERESNGLKPEVFRKK
ncbi:MAG: hypothetical protein PHV74_12780 [Dehalococcoidia bacterium]|nr:hypothetical protein [Dehalococcoidia bacterium]